MSDQVGSTPLDPARLSALDTTKANVARVYDASAGGKDNYAVDRRLHRQIVEVSSGAERGALSFRRWLIRAVRFLAMNAGIEQFIELGSGLPAEENVHEVAQRIKLHAQVVYADNDPIVVARGRALLGENDCTHVVEADLREPHAVLRHPVVTRYLDLTQPVALLQSATLQHLDDAEQPHRIMSAYIDALPSGSYVAISHVHDPCDNGPLTEVARSVEEMYRQESSGVIRFRTREEIAAFFDGLELVEPGLVPIEDWWREGPKPEADWPHLQLALGAVGRKP